MKGTVLITGGAGRVGRQVAARLCSDDWHVRVFDLPTADFAGLEGAERVELVRGDITRVDAVVRALENVSAVIHLAAILPPASERDRELTFRVNVEASRTLARELERRASEAPLVFGSSVSTYGDTAREEPSIAVSHPQRALDIYAESKIAAERAVRDTASRTVVLRISGIAVPGFQEPPQPWPFRAEQRIEFVHRDDVAAALAAAVGVPEAWGRTLNVAGGASWRTTGLQYVSDYYRILGVPVEEAGFQAQQGWFDWYDTADSQRLLAYQNTRYESYLAETRAEVQRLMER